MTGSHFAELITGICLHWLEMIGGRSGKRWHTDSYTNHLFEFAHLYVHNFAHNLRMLTWSQQRCGNISTVVYTSTSVGQTDKLFTCPEQINNT